MTDWVSAIAAAYALILAAGGCSMTIAAGRPGLLNAAAPTLLLDRICAADAPAVKTADRVAAGGTTGGGENLSAAA